MVFRKLMLVLFMLFGLFFVYEPANGQVIWNNPTASFWMTPSNWAGGVLPSSGDIAQFNANPTSATTGVGINMDTARGSVTIGALYVSPSRTSNLIVGNSSPATVGTLYLNGDTVSGIANVQIANMASNFARLTLQNTQGSGGSLLRVDLGGSGGKIMTGAGTSTGVGNTINISAQLTATAPIWYLGGGTWDAASGTGNNGGMLRLGNTNAFTNGIIVGDTDGTQNGILQLDSTAAVSNTIGNNININKNSQLVLSAPNGSVYQASNIVLALNGYGNNYTSTGKGALTTASGLSYVWDGGISLPTDASIAALGTTTQSLTVTGNITGIGSLTKYGGGTLWVRGPANNWAGGTIVSSGRLIVDTTSSLSTGPLVMAQAGQNPVLVFNNGLQTITSLSSSFTGTNNNCSITLNGTRLIIQQDSNTSYGGPSAALYSTIAGTGGIVKRGTGTLTLTSPGNSFSGGLKITSGGITLNPNFGTTATLSGPDTLDGGTLSTEGINRTFTYTLGTLTLTDNSTIRLSSDTLHSLKFANSSSTGWTPSKMLTIYNWAGGYNSTAGTKGKIFVGTNTSGLTSSQLAQIRFVDSYGNIFAATILSTGEVVPLSPTITTTAALYGPYCNNVSNTLSVSFTTTGPITGNYKIQLSGPTGTFANDTVTNIIGLGTSSPVTATLPTGYVGGTGYRLRVLNTRPAIVFGSNNGSNITIVGAPNAGVISGPTFVSVGATANYAVSATGGVWQSSDTTVALVGGTGVLSARTTGTTTLTYTVTNSCGLTAYSIYPIRISAIPSITSVSPDTGHSGATVTITGTNFNPIASGNTVFFGPVKASVLSATTTTLVVTLPRFAGAAVVSVTDTVSSLTGYARTPFLPGYANTGLMNDTVNLALPVDFATAPNPVGVASGDFDGDGKTDVVVANSGRNNLYIYLNTSSLGTIDASSFAAPVIYSSGSIPYYLKAADMDGDGKLDILVANSSTGTNKVSIYRNTSSPGTISFATRVDITAATAPLDISIADMDMDGKPDLIVANTYLDKIYLLKNNTSPGFIAMTSFGAAVGFTTGSSPLRLFTGDLNGDGLPDVAVTNYSDNTVSVFKNNGNRGNITTSSLATPITLATDGSPAGIAGADLDDDGYPELLVTNSGVNSLSVFQNTCFSGFSFATQTTFATPSTPSDVTIADMDGDGKPDAAVTNFYGNSVSVYLNRSSFGSISAATLAAPTSFATGTSPAGIIATDLDGDNKADIALVNSVTATLSIYKNYPLPDAGRISGRDTLCTGATSTFTNPISGGTWFSTSPTIATVTSTGIVTALATGTDSLGYYTVAQGDTNFTFHTLTVLPSTAVAPIAASSTNICVGSITTLADSTPRGVWTSSDTTRAIVDAAGVVTGRGVGAVIITYSINYSCSSAQDTILLQVAPASGFVVAPIVGAAALCQGAATTFTNSTTGGTWSSSDIVVAVVNATGLVTPREGGNTIISYGFSGACGIYRATIAVHVDTPLFADSIYCPATICPSVAVTIAPYGSLGGVWAASNSRLSVTSLGVVTGLSAGLDTVSYTVSNVCGTHTATKVVTVLAPATAGTIAGPASVCVGQTVLVTGFVAGGSWYRENTTATLVPIGPDSANVNGNTAGIDTFYYVFANPCGTDTAQKVVTVNPIPNAGSLTGPTSVCVGDTINLRSTITGGVWGKRYNFVSVADTLVIGLTPGTDTITYSVTSPFGCGTAIAIKKVAVNDYPFVDTITGPGKLCLGDSIQLSNTTTGGIWTKTNPRLNVFATGKVKALAAGLDTVIYSVTVNGCTSTTTKVVEAIAIPVLSAITGAVSVCAGGATAIVRNATPNGYWRTTGNFTVLNDTVVTGVIPGVDTIYYALDYQCLADTAVRTVSVNRKITVNPLPYADEITGATEVFAGDTILLQDSIKGGTWSVVGPNSIINANGFLGGLKAGLDTVRYVVTNSCGRDTALLPVTIFQPNGQGTITNFTIYPNPGRDVFTVILESKISESISLLISDASFKVVDLLWVPTNTPTDIHLNLPPGIYIFSAITKGKWFTIKVAVMN